MTIERIRQKFIKSADKNEQENYRFVNLGKYTVNVESLSGYETIHKEDEKYHFKVVREEIQNRSGRSDPHSRFATNIAEESVKEGNVGYANMIGTEWQLKYGGFEVGDPK